MKELRPYLKDKTEFTEIPRDGYSTASRTGSAGKQKDKMQDLPSPPESRSPAPSTFRGHHMYSCPDSCLWPALEFRKVSPEFPELNTVSPEFTSLRQAVSLDVA